MRHAITLLCLFLGAAAVMAYPSGMPNGYAGQPPSGANCVNCHSSYPLNSGNGYLQIAGLPSTGYVPGTTYSLTVILADPGQMRWGYECTSIYQSGSSYLQAGDFTVTDPTHTTLGVGSGTSPDYMKYTSAGTYPGTPGPTSWSFNWTAPAATTGLITFYMSGAACNNTGGTGGDYCYTNSATSNPAGSTPNVFVTLTPIGSTVIPASGGTLNYNIAGGNNGSSAIAVDIWVDVTLPNGSTYGPVLGPLLNFNLPAGFSTNRNRALAVAGSSPAGNYMLNGYFGDYTPPNNTIWAEDHMPFSKLVTGMGPWESGWFVDSGEPFEEASVSVASPVNYLLAQSYPNPFNPTATIAYQLPAAGRVRIDIFDARGNQITTLVNGWREAGRHEATFEATGLASGLYVYQIHAGDLTASGKMMLLK